MFKRLKCIWWQFIWSLYIFFAFWFILFVRGDFSVSVTKQVNQRAARMFFLTLTGNDSIYVRNVLSMWSGGPRQAVIDTTVFIQCIYGLKHNHNTPVYLSDVYKDLSLYDTSQRSGHITNGMISLWGSTWKTEWKPSDTHPAEVTLNARR